MKYDVYVDQLQQLRLPNAIIEKDILFLEFRPVRDHWRDERLIVLVQAVVRYSSIYNEPELLVRCWTCRETDGVEITELFYPAEIGSLLGLPQEFVVGLDVSINESNGGQYPSRLWGAWYSVHPCDTAEIIGTDRTCMDRYLQRWASVFLNWTLEL